MTYLKEPLLKNIEPLVNRAVRRYTMLDSIDHPCFSYRLDGLSISLGPESIRTNALIDCTNRYVSGKDYFIVSTAGAGHAYLEYKEGADVQDTILEAQEYIGCSSETIADEIEGVLRNLSGSRNGIDFIFDIMGDTLRFDRKSCGFRGWTGGYLGLGGPIGQLSGIDGKNMAWHDNDIVDNLTMRLDALYFLGELINEHLGHRFSLEQASEDRIDADSQFRNVLGTIDEGYIHTLNKIRDVMEARGIKTEISMASGGTYSVESKDRYKGGMFGGSNPVWSYVEARNQPFARIDETFINSNLDGVLVECLNRLSSIKSNRKSDSYLIFINSERGIPGLMIERPGEKFSYETFLTDLEFFENLKHRIALGRDIP